TSEAELPALAELFRRGKANGVAGLEEIGPERIKEIEPHAAGIKALHVPGTGIVDYRAVAKKYVELIRAQGGEVQTGVKVFSARRDADGNEVLETSAAEIRAKTMINCAGLFSDRMARAS